VRCQQQSPFTAVAESVCHESCSQVVAVGQAHIRSRRLPCTICRDRKGRHAQSAAAGLPDDRVAKVR
jgi:hypothetical protein